MSAHLAESRAGILLASLGRRLARAVSALNNASASLSGLRLALNNSALSHLVLQDNLG
jgi:hypothetical protein